MYRTIDGVSDTVAFFFNEHRDVAVANGLSAGRSGARTRYRRRQPDKPRGHHGQSDLTPLTGLLGYDAELKTLTRGQAQFRLIYDHYAAARPPDELRSRSRLSTELKDGSGRGLPKGVVTNAKRHLAG